MVEMAVVLPVFMMLVLGIVEFGRALSVGQMVTNASREACRRSVLDDSESTAIESEIKTFLAGSLDVTTSDVTVECYVNDALANVSTAVENDKIRVRVEVDANDVAYFSGKFLLGKTLGGETTMRHE
jgi:Flp pilus assembly protein TadG